MNLMQMRCAIAVAKEGSLNKASKKLSMAPPNLSRAIKELEECIDCEIFYRTSKGMALTPEGESFIHYAKIILEQVDGIKNVIKKGKETKQRFSISVPRAAYISEAFAAFSKIIDDEAADIFYTETNASLTIKNILEFDYKLGIVRYAKHHDRYFKNLFVEKGLIFEEISEFKHKAIMSKNSPLAKRPYVSFEELAEYIEITHTDDKIAPLPLIAVKKDSMCENISKRIYVSDRGIKTELLSKNPKTFIWSSETPEQILDQFALVQKDCPDNQKIYKDVLIQRKEYKRSKLDEAFIHEVYASKKRNLY